MQSNLQEWYSLMISTSTQSEDTNWLKITNGSEFEPNLLEHGFHVSVLIKIAEIAMQGLLHVCTISYRLSII